MTMTVQWVLREMMDTRMSKTLKEEEEEEEEEACSTKALLASEHNDWFQG